MRQVCFVVVSGPPASGKTTLARRLGPALGLPVLSKDELKQELAEDLPPATVEESRRLGSAAVAAMLRVARGMDGAVIDSVWADRAVARCELARLPAPVVEVFCRCSEELAHERFAARSAGRSGIHFDGERMPDELWNADVAEPVAGEWPVIEVSTEVEPDIHELVARILDKAAGGGVAS